MKLAPPGPVVTQDGARASRPWTTWAASVSSLLTATAASGTTAQRPTSFLYVGRPYFDTTIGKPLWYSGAAWVDATGAAV